ncbi:MAG: FxsA family protein [Actinobacteria bacterium]|nr:FxsA family protein [Actinomycetota bacterium]MCA1719987.1 FxsA family protein [Actinomycetota bacterium]
MGPLLLVAFIVVPIAELYVLVQVGQQIGVLPTIAILLVDSLVGAWLLKREGRKAWAAFRRALDEKRVPATEVADGALVIFGGALLLTPGFLSDVLGLLCVLPPSRAGLRRVLTGLVARRLGVVGLAAGMAGRQRSRTRAGDVVDGEVVENAEGRPPRGGRPLDGSS